MRIVDSFPHRVREIESCWIPMRDGARLSARIWRPEDTPPVPALVEYLPYRKRDRTRARDEPIHRWYAGHGYASIRIDLRGSGESDGLLLDEYLPIEQQDGVDAIAWIAAQPWCSGAVGMMGKSWGGFNALQIASHRPPALKAIVTLCSTDDRFSDDAHYMGGCLLNENLVWGSILQSIQTHPPDPELAGERWRDLWLDRLKQTPLFPEVWLRHPSRDDYWKQGSICEDYGAIECAVYAIGGWKDAYVNAVPRLLSNLSCPRKGLIGPWAHVYPHESGANAIGFLQDTLRWWDRWLKGEDNGVMDEPMLRAWLCDRWIAEWPLATEPASHTVEPNAAIRSPLSTGLTAPRWCSFSEDPSEDQRPDDAGSILIDLDPMQIEIIGAPVARLELEIDRPIGMIAVRLLDVGPDGSSTRVTYGLRRLTEQDRTVRIELNQIAHRFEPGHRARFAISTSYWPIAWPAPEPFTLLLHRATFELPVRAQRSDPPYEFDPPEQAAASPILDLDPDRFVHDVDRNGGFTTITSIADANEDGSPAMQRIEAIGLDYGHGMVERYRINDDDPLSAEAETENRVALRRAGWSIETTVRMRMTSTRESYRLEARLEAREGGECVFVRGWDRTIARDEL